MSDDSRAALLYRYAATKYTIDDNGVIRGPRGPLGVRLNKSGYRYFCVRFDGRICTLEVHRLAGYQWFGEAVFVSGMEVRHLDGDSSNNKRSNLLFGTHSQNMMDRPPEVRLRIAKEAASHLRKHDDLIVAAIRSDRESGMKYADIMAKYDIGKSTLSYLINRASY